MIWIWAAFASDPWAETIERVLDAVVVIEMDRTRPFDGNGQSSTEASGFVVDAERGIVLTNRHVVTHGPTRATAIFVNEEEVDLVPLYVDPVHDFGFFQYEPTDLLHNRPPSLPLVANGASVGQPIRVIGNDAAERLSILGGTISRLDRSAPNWDFNTFYLQAASSTSGGSSGSPVFDIEGRVIALNAGARTDAATSLFLPLQRVVVALEALREGRTPERGTVQTVFQRENYEELQRLGLSDDDAATARKRWPLESGLLVVGRVTPKGPADGILEEGDVLWAVDGVPVASFATVEGVLDGAVGASITVELMRRGDRITKSLTVGDLHALTPSRYLEIGEGLLHDLPYTRAVRNPRAVEGVAIARAGRLFADAGLSTSAVLERVGDVPVSNLDEAIDALQKIGEGQRVQVGWSAIGTPDRKRVSTVWMSRELWPTRVCRRESDGSWPCDDLAGPPAPSLSVVPVRFHELASKRYGHLARSLVEVRFRPLLNVDSAEGVRRDSLGILLDDSGLILTDRHAIPMTAGQVVVRIGPVASAPADIVYVDPIHNVALVRIRPGRLALNREVDPIEWSDEPLEVGDEPTLVALDKKGGVYTDELKLERVVAGSFRASRHPRWVDRDLDFYRVGGLDRPTLGGVVVDKKGRVRGLMQPFPQEDGGHSSGLNLVDAHPIREALRRFRENRSSAWSLGVDLWPRALSEVRGEASVGGLADRLLERTPDRPQVLQVSRVSGDSPAGDVLEVGDWIVSVNGLPVTRFRDVEDAVSASDGTIRLERIRRGRSETVSTSLLAVPTSTTERVVRWAGALIQVEPPVVALDSQSPRQGVYLSWFYGGSPAHRYQTGYGRRIVAVDGTPVEDVDGFLELANKGHRESVQLTMQSLKGEEWVLTLRLDQQFWPTTEYRREPDGTWSQAPYDSPARPSE